MPFVQKIKLASLPGIVQTAGGQAVLQIEPGDFNGDGKQDLLISRAQGFVGTSATTFIFLLGDGNGGWVDQSSALFGGTAPGVFFAPRVAVADLNRDGRSDVYVPDFGTDSAPFSGKPDQVWLSNAAGGLTAVTSTLGNTLAHGISTADVDRDGDIDVLVDNLSNASVGTGADQLLLNNGAGAFTWQTTALPAVLQPSNPTKQSHTWSLLADLNNDGFPDMVLGADENVGGSVSATAPPSRVLMNDGRGSFATSTITTLPASPVASAAIVYIASMDLNNDGLLDLLVSSTQGGPSSAGYYRTGYLQFLVNKGAGVFADETAARWAQTAGAAGAWWKFVRPIDMNGDGALDLVLTGAGANATSTDVSGKVLLNDGAGKFTDAFTLRAFDATPETLSPVDVNNDGLPDLVATRFDSSSATSINAYINDLPRAAPRTDLAPKQVYGTSGADQLTGSTGRDWFHPLAGNDTLSGGLGLDVAVYNSARASYQVAVQASGAVQVTGSAASDGIDSLSQIERLQFSDTKLAVDMSGNAGITAKVLGAVFGRAQATNKEYVGIGLGLLDGGLSYVSLVQAALNAKLGAGASNTAVVNLLYTNLTGAAPNASELALYKGMLDSGTLTAGNLAVIASEHTLNQTNINLVGLASTGIDYL